MKKTIKISVLALALAVAMPATAQVKILGKTKSGKTSQAINGQQSQTESQTPVETKAKTEPQVAPQGEDESVATGEVKYIGATSDKYQYATPDALGKPGPFPANTDFYFISATQGTGVSVVAGDPSIMKGEGRVELFFDVSRVQFGKENWLEDYRKVDDPQEVEEVLSRANSYFYYEFNRKNKKGMHVVKAKETVEDAPYILVVRLRKLNKGNATDFWLGSSVKAGGASIDGTVEVLDAKNHEILCVYGFNDIKGGNHATKKTRVGLAFYELARQMGKLVRGPKK